MAEVTRLIAVCQSAPPAMGGPAAEAWNTACQAPVSYASLQADLPPVFGIGSGDADDLQSYLLLFDQRFVPTITRH